MTYGARASLLIQALDAARSSGIAAAVVIDNGSAIPVEPVLTERYGAWVHVQRFERNHGSAPGFNAGITCALRRGAEFLLLLDDDNILQSGCVSTLRRVFAEKLSVGDRRRLALMAFRPDKHQRILNQSLGLAPLRIKSTFRGFHVFDIPTKIWNRLRPVCASNAESIAPLPVPWAPFSGFFFHRDLIQEIGLPNGDFILYADDFDFTYRVTKNRGVIYLVPNATIKDIEESWHGDTARVSVYDATVNMGSDTQVYYSFRNGVFFDTHSLEANWVMTLVNMLFYMSVIAFVAMRGLRIRRLLLLLRALNDGLKGKLGENPAHKLA